jgi:hypothetical protein
MALPDYIKYGQGTPVIFADTTDYGPAAANNFGSRTHQLDLTSVADGAARQSAKADLGASRDVAYLVIGVFELAATPTAGEFVELYWAPSSSGTAATANVMGVSGSDAAYAGLGSDLANSVAGMQPIGVHKCTDDPTGTVQGSVVNAAFSPASRYGSVIVKNESGAAMHSDAVEMSVVLIPIVVTQTDT